MRFSIDISPVEGEVPTARVVMLMVGACYQTLANLGPLERAVKVVKISFQKDCGTLWPNIEFIIANPAGVEAKKNFEVRRFWFTRRPELAEVTAKELAEALSDGELIECIETHLERCRSEAEVIIEEVRQILGRSSTR